MGHQQCDLFQGWQFCLVVMSRLATDTQDPIAA